MIYIHADMKIGVVASYNCPQLALSFDCEVRHMDPHCTFHVADVRKS